MKILALCIIFHLSFLQSLAEECTLDMRIPSSWNNSDKNNTNGTFSESNWDGFLQSNGCGEPFEVYLYGLAKRANKTEESIIFLNTTQQDDCLSSLNTAKKDVNISSCGIERLSAGHGGCSDYSADDAVSRLGNKLKNLEEDCKDLGKDEKNCGSCLEKWEDMGEEESGICRFSVLVTLMSRRVDDVGWIQSVCTCLGNGNNTSAADETRHEKKIKFITGLEVLMGGVGGISVMVAVVWLVLFKKPTKTEKAPEVMDAKDESFHEESSSVKISIQQVYLATNNLSESYFIGQGVAGKVYKGILSNGQHIAVKHIANDGHMESFVREVTSLSHVKHPNLVELIGHCDGEDESFLVYELCDNGNLSEWLFGKQKFLNWIQRLEIAVDCAKGLRFLHSYPEGCIVHRDIKPTNILLGANFQAKLSDFGLSKVINTGVSYVSSEVRGTFGYVDPEYQKNHHVHSSTDVYSFGMVLLQLLSGQRVINLELTRPMPLSKMAKNLIKGGDITEFADPKLNGEYSCEAFEIMFKLALSCIGLKQQRPSMEKVLLLLERARRLSSERINSFDSY